MTLKPYEFIKPAQTPTKYGRCDDCGYTLGNHDGFKCWRYRHCDCGADLLEDEDFNKVCAECEKVVDECFCDMP